MAQLNDPKKIEQLLNDLQSKDKAIRTKAASKLGNIDPENSNLASKVVGALRAMVEQENYKIARDIAQHSIKKIIEPEKAKAEANRRSLSQLDYPNDSEARPQYSAMRTLGSVYGILGSVVLVLSLVVAIFGGASASDESPVLAIGVFFGSILFGVISALPMLAANNFISLLVNQAKDIRRIRSAIGDLLREE